MKNWADGLPRIRKFKPQDCPVEGRVITWGVNGLTGEIDGKPAVVAGLHRWHGKLWLFFQIIDERARRPAFLHRRAKSFMATLRACGEPIYVHREPNEPASARWLTRLGFLRTGRKHLGYEVWTLWQR
jgi:hypothetical protein